MDHATFIALSFVLRIIEALGAAAAVVAAFTLIGSIFPNMVATVFATLETFYGFGYIIGPTLGSILFDIGGFPAPFIFVGIVTAVVALSILVLVPDIHEKNTVHNETGNNFYRLLHIPSILIGSACTVAVASSVGFYSATLEPHIREFKLKPVTVGFIFIISGGTYAVVAPIIGRMVDRCIRSKSMMIVGCILNIISFSIVGPAPFVPLPKTLTICIIALVFNGLSLAAINVSTFIDAIKTAIECGFSDDLSTYGLMSGIWTSSFSLGAFIGPAVAGYLFDQFGFQKASLFVVISHIILFFVLVVYVILPEKNLNSRQSTAVYDKSNGYGPFGDQDDASFTHLIEHQKESHFINKNGDYKIKQNENSYGTVVNSL